MPVRRKYMKRRQLRRKRYNKRNAIRRLNSRSPGYINVNRRLPHISCEALAFAGGIQTTDPTGTCLTLGTPTQVPGTTAGMNMYDVPFTLAFNLAQITGSGEFTTLFDYYKINGVKVQVKVKYFLTVLLQLVLGYHGSSFGMTMTILIQCLHWLHESIWGVSKGFSMHQRWRQVYM